MKFLKLLMLGAVGSCLGMRADIAQKHWKQETLSNGLTIIAARYPQSSNVLVQMLYEVGATSEDATEKGMAHLVEHMIFKGTNELQEGALTAIARRFGASYNACTWFDFTSYYFTLNKSNWKPFLSILADCMQNCVFDEECLASELKAVVQELRMRADNPNVTLFDASIQNVFPKDHPIYPCVIGFKEDLANLKAADLKKFYKKYYRPDKATLFIVGDVALDEAINEARKIFETIPAANTDSPAVTFDNSMINHGVSAVAKRSVKQEKTMLSWIISDIVNPRMIDVATILSEVLTGGTSSVLMRRLVDEEKCALSVSSGPEIIASTDVLLFMIDFIPYEGQTEKCLSIITEELAKIACQGVETSDLNRTIKMHMLSDEIKKELMTSGQSGLDTSFFSAYFLSHDPDYLFGDSSRYLTISSPEIKAFVSTYLRPSVTNRTDLVPLKEEEMDQWRAHQIEEQKLEQAILDNHQRTRAVVEPEIPERYRNVNDFNVSVPKSTVSEVLENGLQVIVRHEQDAVLSAMTLNHRDISKMYVGRSGVKISLLNLLMRESAAGMTKQQKASWFEQRGAYASAGCSGASLLTITPSFKECFEQLINFMRNPTLDADDLEKVRKEVLLSYQLVKDDQFSCGSNAVERTLFPGSAYAITFDEMQKVAESATCEELRELYKKITHPAAYVLAITTPIDPREMLNIVHEVMRGWKAEGSSYESVTIDIPACTDKTDYDEQMDKDQTYFGLVRRSKTSRNAPEYPALCLAEQVLFASLGSRLFKIREQTGLFYVAGGSIGRMKHDDLVRTDGLIALLSPEKLEQADILFREFLAQGTLEPISQDELESARMTIKHNTLSSFNTISGRTNYLAGVHIDGRGEGYLDKFIFNINRLTAPQVSEYLKNYYSQGDSFVRVRVGNF